MWWFTKKVNNLPEATGHFAPGCVDVMLDYDKEGILMRLYYPTETKKDDPNNSRHWCSWMPGDKYLDGIAKVLMSFPFLIRFMHWWSAGIIPVIYGAKPKVDKKLKCIVLSHGLGGQRSLYSNICCELASRGYLVAALEHRDHSACYTFYYKSKDDAENKISTDIEYHPFEVGKNHFKQRQRQVYYRAKECGKVVDVFYDLNNGKVPRNVIDDVPTRRQIHFRLEDLAGKLDLESLTMAGHSFGGATALLTLSQRQEFKQGILLDPWMFPIKDENLDDKVHQPLLFINTQTFHIVSNVEMMAKFLKGNHRTMFTILHTTHESQTDTVLLIGYWLNWFMKKLDPVVALKINNALILNFLDKHVGSPSDIEDAKRILEEEKSNIDVGLTKPWA